MKVEPFGPLDLALYRETVRLALAEDLRWGDITTDAAISTDVRAVGEIVAGVPCVLAGLDVAIEVFRQLEPRLEIERPHQDGDKCSVGEIVLRVTGRGRALLTAERTALNFLQRLSGIATLTWQFVDVARGRTMVLDTRKTTPTLRSLEKYAVRAGGGVNHRMALDDGILIKDNHIRLAGSIREAVERVRRVGHDMLIEVEAQSIADVVAAVAAGVDVILADNMDTADIQEVVRLTRGQAKVEVSGGITLDRLDEVAAVEPEYVSVGALTHSAPAIDFSFDLSPEVHPARLDHQDRSSTS
jgi:nicotinate-nucleotide pyrophosphorylase (carboxylating)